MTNLQDFIRDYGLAVERITLKKGAAMDEEAFEMLLEETMEEIKNRLIG